MQMFLVNQLHSGCFENLNKMEIVVDCLSVIDLCQFSLHIYILIVVRFHLLLGRIYCFVVFQLLFFV